MEVVNSDLLSTGILVSGLVYIVPYLVSYGIKKVIDIMG